MYNKLKILYLAAQIVISVSIIIFGVASALRCLKNGKADSAILFAAVGYLSGYEFLLKASLIDLHLYMAARRQAKS